MPFAIDRTVLIRAVDLALAADGDGAHGLIDAIDDDPTACWIHA